MRTYVQSLCIPYIWSSCMWGPRSCGKQFSDPTHSAFNLLLGCVCFLQNPTMLWRSVHRHEQVPVVSPHCSNTVYTHRLLARDTLHMYTTAVQCTYLQNMLTLSAQQSSTCQAVAGWIVMWAGSIGVEIWLQCELKSSRRSPPVLQCFPYKY